MRGHLEGTGAPQLTAHHGQEIGRGAASLSALGPMEHRDGLGSGRDVDAWGRTSASQALSGPERALVGPGGVQVAQRQPDVF